MQKEDLILIQNHHIMKNKYLRLLKNSSMIAMIICCMWLIDSCVSMAPVGSNYESAKSLGKGNIELMGNYSSYSLRTEDEYEEKGIENVNKNYGFRIGCGISPRVDLKFRYERLIPALQEDKDQLNGANYFALSSKFSILENHIAAALDAGFYTYTLKEDNQHSEEIFFFTPRLTLTYPTGKYFDLTLNAKIDLLPSEGLSYLGFNLGCGISSDLDKWSLRPEIGFINDFSGTTWFNAGIAVILKFDTSKAGSQ
jgi:hypothetical protein